MHSLHDPIRQRSVRVPTPALCTCLVHLQQSFPTCGPRRYCRWAVKSFSKYYDFCVEFFFYIIYIYIFKSKLFYNKMFQFSLSAALAHLSTPTQCRCCRPVRCPAKRGFLFIYFFNLNFFSFRVICPPLPSIRLVSRDRNDQNLCCYWPDHFAAGPGCFVYI